MRENELREQILELFRSVRDRAYSAGEIAAALHLRGKARKKLTGWLKRLCVEGLLGQTSQRYHRAAPPAYGSGVPPRGRPLPGGRARRNDRWEATSWERLRGAFPPRTLPAECVGTLHREGAALFVVLGDRRLNARVQVADCRGAHIGDRVVVRLPSALAGRTLPFAGERPSRLALPGEIVEVLGPGGALSTETLAAVRHYGLAEEFPDDVLAEVDQSLDRVADPGPRMDARDRLILTIDPERARDFDDALSLDIDSAGNRVLGVHIADVSHYVLPGSALDREARRRGNSVYFPDRVLPMLPTALSNGVCSLRPGEDRLAVSVFLTFDPNGRVLRREFARSTIRNGLRLTYEQAFQILTQSETKTREGKALPLRPAAFDADPSLEISARALLRQLHTLAQQLRRRRFERGALDLDVPDLEIVLGADRDVVDLRLVENDVAHQLIEECMVAANEAVAQELSQRGITIISRLHEPPAEEKIADLTVALGQLGLAPGDLSQPRVLSRFLRSVSDHPLVRHIRTLVLRSMKRAVYSARARGHFGLAKRYYAHFTSPIRRYPDLILHRQLVASLSPEDPGPAPLIAGLPIYRDEELAHVAFGCSETERTAEEAERFVVENMKFQYLANRIGSSDSIVYDAGVVRIMRIGVFVEVPALQVQGLIPAGAFLATGRRPRVDRSRRRVFVGDRVLEPGSSIRVRLNRVDMEKMQIDFAPVDGP